MYNIAIIAQFRYAPREVKNRHFGFLILIFSIESVDSISRDERGFPLTQYITNGEISPALNTMHHRVLILRLISNKMSV